MIKTFNEFVNESHDSLTNESIYNNEEFLSKLRTLIDIFKKSGEDAYKTWKTNDGCITHNCFLPELGFSSPEIFVKNDKLTDGYFNPVSIRRFSGYIDDIGIKEKHNDVHVYVSFAPDEKYGDEYYYADIENIINIKDFVELIDEIINS